MPSTSEPPATASEAELLRWLLSTAAVRTRCRAMLELAQLDALPHFELDPDRFDDVVDEVVSVTRAAHPRLDVPLHSRWGHFDVGGIDRLGPLRARFTDPSALARARIDLVIVSVLLDAGSGPTWRYVEAQSGRTFTRSEGLAVATLRAFEAGLFSSDPADPLRVDAARLQALDESDLGRAFTVDEAHPLAGLSGRLDLMHRLGAVLQRGPSFASTQRPSALLDAIGSGPIDAARLLELVLDALSEIWPGRLSFAGRNLGDVWRHPSGPGQGPTAGLVPLHKLSQWLTYSLVEPLSDAGVVVRELDGLTGLAEYRNGGLLLDLGLLRLRDDAAATAVYTVDDPLIVEWRALTVALLDEIAEAVRARLGVGRDRLPLGAVLEGGTWRAGRIVAARLRPDGSPPLRIASDGTVF